MRLRRRSGASAAGGRRACKMRRLHPALSAVIGGGLRGQGGWPCEQVPVKGEQRRWPEHPARVVFCRCARARHHSQRPQLLPVGGLELWLVIQRYGRSTSGSAGGTRRCLPELAGSQPRCARRKGGAALQQRRCTGPARAQRGRERRHPRARSRQQVGAVPWADPGCGRLHRGAGKVEMIWAQSEVARGCLGPLSCGPGVAGREKGVKRGSEGLPNCRIAGRRWGARRRGASFTSDALQPTPNQLAATQAPALYTPSPHAVPPRQPRAVEARLDSAQHILNHNMRGVMHAVPAAAEDACAHEHRHPGRPRCIRAPHVCGGVVADCIDGTE